MSRDRNSGDGKRTPRSSNARNRRAIAVAGTIAFLAILLVVLVLIFRSDDESDAGQLLDSAGVTASDDGAVASSEDDAASGEDVAAGETPTPDAAEEVAWYEGGTLRAGNGDDWKNATARDRLATAAAIAAEALGDSGSEPVHPEEMSEEELSAFRSEAEALAACIDEAAQADGSASVERMATTCWTQAHPAPEK